MEFQPHQERLSEARLLLPQSTVPEARQRLFLNVYTVLCFLVVLSCVFLFCFFYFQILVLSPLRFFGTLGVLLLAVSVLTLLLVNETKAAERLVVGEQFQSRVDLLEKRKNDLDDMLEIVADHQETMIALFGQGNRFCFINEPAARRLGKTAIEIIGKTPVKILSPKEVEKLEERLTEVRTSKIPLEIIDRLTDAEGKTKFLRSRYEIVSDGSSMNGCILLREDDFTAIIIERERREQMLRQVIDTMVGVVDRRDPYATGHSARVGKLSKAIAEEMALDEQFVDAAEIAGSLMNFGKVLVSRRILTKTTLLTPEELQRVRDGILTSADILEIISFDSPVVPTLRQVLERYDGKGVPEGIAGEQILITARIVAAANAFVAFVSPRAHREGMSFDVALRAIGNDSGKAFDEEVLLALTRYVEKNAQKLGWLRGGVAKPF